MRFLSVFATGSLILLAACDGTPDQMLKETRNQVTIHFSALNKEAALMGIESKANRPASEEPISMGRTFSNYQWSDTGFILTDVKCTNAKCAATQVVVTYYGAEIKCPACGAGSMDTVEKAASKAPLVPGNLTESDLAGKYGNVLKMFEKVNDNPPVVLIRYVRRQWVHDATGRVDAKTIERAATGPGAIDGLVKAAPNNYYGGGYHREVAVFTGTTAFVFQGGAIRQVDVPSVEKLAAGEKVTVSSMKLGTSVAKEVYVKTWNLPRNPEEK